MLHMMLNMDWQFEIETKDLQSMRLVLVIDLEEDMMASLSVQVLEKAIRSHNVIVLLPHRMRRHCYEGMV
jgi:hypothetical protein